MNLDARRQIGAAQADEAAGAGQRLSPGAAFPVRLRRFRLAQRGAPQIGAVVAALADFLEPGDQNVARDEQGVAGGARPEAFEQAVGVAFGGLKQGLEVDPVELRGGEAPGGGPSLRRVAGKGVPAQAFWQSFLAEFCQCSPKGESLAIITLIGCDSSVIRCSADLHCGSDEMAEPEAKPALAFDSKAASRSSAAGRCF
jgi:hypothetical protein